MQTILLFIGSLIFAIFMILRLVITLKQKDYKNRMYIKDVMANDYVFIEHHSGVVRVICLNNDPETKKILLQYQYVDNTKEAVVLNYNDKQLKNFHLLNSTPKWKEENKKVDDNFDISTLQNKLNEALDKEEYEKANELQNKINKLLKK